MRGNNHQKSSTPYCRCRVLYLGSSVPHASKEGLLGIQEPLKDLYPEQGVMGARGIDSWLSVWSNGLLLENFDENCKRVARFFPIESLHYCAAVRYVKGGGRKMSNTHFLPLDSPFARTPSAEHPPLFAAVLRRTTGIKVLECHAFICKRDVAANALVRCCFHAHADSKFANGLETTPNNTSGHNNDSMNPGDSPGNLYQTLNGSNNSLEQAVTKLDADSNDDGSIYNGNENHMVWPKEQDEVDAIYQRLGTMRSVKGSRPRQLIAPPPPPPPPQPVMESECTSSKKMTVKKLKKLKNRTLNDNPLQNHLHYQQMHAQPIYGNGPRHNTLAHPIRHPHQIPPPPPNRMIPGTLPRQPPVLLIPASTLPRKLHHPQMRPIPAPAPIVPIYAPLPMVPPLPPKAIYSGNRSKKHQDQMDYSALGVSRRLAASQANLTSPNKDLPLHAPDSPGNESRFGTGIYKRKGHLNERAFSQSIRAENRSRSHGSLASIGFEGQNGNAFPSKDKKDQEIAHMIGELNLDNNDRGQNHVEASNIAQIYGNHRQRTPQPLPRPKAR